MVSPGVFWVFCVEMSVVLNVHRLTKKVGLCLFNGPTSVLSQIIFYLGDRCSRFHCYHHTFLWDDSSLPATWGSWYWTPRVSERPCTSQLHSPLPQCSSQYQRRRPPPPVNVHPVGGYQVSKGWSYRLVLPPIVICSTIPIETDLVSTRYKELALERPPLSPGITPPVEVKCRASQVAPLAAKVVIWWWSPWGWLWGFVEADLVTTELLYLSF